MAADDFMESEVAIAAAATAALFSPRVREVARKGAVYGVAGVLTVGRTVAGVARDAGRGVGSALPLSRPTRSAAASSSSRSRTAGTPRRPRSGAARSKPAARSGNRGGGKTQSTGSSASSGSGSAATTSRA